MGLAITPPVSHAHVALRTFQNTKLGFAQTNPMISNVAFISDGVLDKTWTYDVL